jgi:hypothetical protein
MESRHPLFLFIYKSFYIYQTDNPPIVPPLLSTGLKTSAQFVVDMLLQQGIRAALAEAKDQNSIQALVDQYQPSRVVLEAIWVTPAKMQSLVAANPGVRWTVRVHSELTFLSNEGMAVGWLLAYAAMGIEIAFNSNLTTANWNETFGAVTCLPNYYPLRQPRAPLPKQETLNIGCFGSIRPLKNQLMQACAALSFARDEGRPLQFHMNAGRVEQLGANNLKNIQAALGSALVLHPWLGHEEFLELIAQMEICLQVSLTESFNICSADAVSIGVPLIGSAAISWLPRRSQAPVDDVGGIVLAMQRAGRTTVHMNHEALENYLATAKKTWLRWAA